MRKIKPRIEVNQQAIQFLNPGQVSVMAMDASLYAIAKYIHLKWPQNYKEDKCVIIFEVCHNEMAVSKTIRDYLSNLG